MDVWVGTGGQVEGRPVKTVAEPFSRIPVSGAAVVVEFVSLPRPRVCCWEPLGGPVLGAVEAVSQCRGWGCSEEALRTPQQGPCRLHSLHLGPEAVSPREARLEGPARVTAAGAGPTCARVHRLRSAWLGQDRGCQTASHRLPAGKLRSRGSGRSEPLYSHHGQACRGATAEASVLSEIRPWCSHVGTFLSE